MDPFRIWGQSAVKSISTTHRSKRENKSPRARVTVSMRTITGFMSGSSYFLKQKNRFRAVSTKGYRQNSPMSIAAVNE